MDIEEIKKHKQIAENKIAIILRDFCAETGLVLASVDVATHTLNQMDGKRETYISTVHLNVEIR